MLALTPLLDDHHYIAGMLDVLDACAQQLHDGGELDHDMAAGVRQYFDRFVPTHERQEDHALFPRLDRDMGETDRQLLAVLRGEHHLLGDLRAALLPYITPAANQMLLPLAAAYSARKREHMRLEDALLHRALHLPDEGLEAQLDEVEREGLGPTGREWFIRMALDYTDIVATWHTHVGDAAFGRRNAELRKRAERGLRT
jgi:hemerythrin-like domain-containing protein